MNRLFRVVRNASRQSGMVASGPAHGTGKRSLLHASSEPEPEAASDPRLPFLSVSAVTGGLIGLNLLTTAGSVLAACTPSATSGLTTTCSGTDQVTTVGAGPTYDNVTLIVNPATTISTGAVSAISLGNSANITIGSGSVIENNAAGTGGVGYWLAGHNTVEFNNNNLVTVETGATISSRGPGISNEAINTLGFGNTIINRGVIEGFSSSAIWLQGTALGTANSIDNYGTIRTFANGANFDAIGSNSNNAVIFTNRTGAAVSGHVTLGNGNDSVTLEAGSVMSGNLNGGTGSNALTLNSSFGSNDAVAGSISNFQTLVKQGAGQWTLSGQVGNNGANPPLAVTVAQGTLTLTGNNSSFNGSVLVNSGGVLEAFAQSLPSGVTDNGIVRFIQSTNGIYAGVITGSGAVEKAGAGVLNLSGVHTYTGTTSINAGTWQTGVNNAFATSSAVNVAGGATLDLNNFNQTANNLSGAGSVTLGNATLTVNETAPTTFGGVVSGSGGLTKTGASALTLTGDNSYAGLTTINTGTLQLGDGGIAGSVAGNIANNAALVVNRSNELILAGTLSGSGSLAQAGAGTTVLNSPGTQGSVNVQQGTLKFLQTGDFTTIGNYTTQGGATTNIGQLQSALRIGGVFTQAANSTLDATLGASPDIVAGSAVLDGNLMIRGFSQSAIPVQASQVISQTYTMLRTTGGITGNFVNNPLGSAGADYLLHQGFVSADTLDYNLGFRMAWTDGGTAAGTGTFTLAPNTAFDVDIALANQTGPFASGWDGQSLTKNGEGLLRLSAANTYTGTTTVNAGTLQTGIVNAFASSSAVSVAGGATLDLNGFDQIANNLSGAGNVATGSAALTANNTAATTFSGPISGDGRLVKTGAATLTLTGDNTYTGGTTISAGTLQLGNGGTTGSLAGDIANNAALAVNRVDALTLGGRISGTGSFTQAGTGTTTLSGANTYSGATTVAAGTLKAGSANTFSAASAHRVSGGATLDTGGFNQTVAALDNAGTVNLLSGRPGSTLAVTGAYVGRGGILHIGTTLGDSSSASDRLVLNGPGASASGSTTVQITNLGGLGALTTGNGIEVVTALNGATTTAQTTKDAFVLGGPGVGGLAKGGATLSAPHIDAGAYQYQLYAADANGQGENWYLRSTTPGAEVPIYRTEVPLVAALPAQMRQGDLAMLANLHRRVGDDDRVRETGGRAMPRHCEIGAAGPGRSTPTSTSTRTVQSIHTAMVIWGACKPAPTCGRVPPGGQGSTWASSRAMSM